MQQSLAYQNNYPAEMCNGAENTVKHYICVSPCNGKRFRGKEDEGNRPIPSGRYQANGNNSQTTRHEQVLTSADLARHATLLRAAHICEVSEVLSNVWWYTEHRSTVRVCVHQSKDGDVQRVPKLSHHQPAVHIWHAFTLIHTNTSVTNTKHSKLDYLNMQITFRISSEKDRQKVKTHCDNDAGSKLCAEVTVQQSLKRGIFLHYHDKLCR